jgi:hypothetical protein
MGHDIDAKKRFTAAYMLMCKALGEEYDPQRRDIYWDILSEEFGPSRIEAGIRGAMRRCKWFPKPAEIRAHIPGVHATPEDAAISAWGEFLAGFRTHGADACRGRTDWTDPAIPHVIARLGGWDAVRNWPERELQWKRKEFVAAYTAAQAAGALPGPDHAKAIDQIKRLADKVGLKIPLQGDGDG